MAWLENAIFTQQTCGVQVDWEDGFYICPECGEPVYSADWNDSELRAELCPICGLTREDLA